MAQKVDDKYAGKEEVKRLNDVMSLIIIVLFIGFAAVFVAATAMLVDSFREKKAISTDMRDEIKAQNDKIDKLTEELRKFNEQKTIQTTN